MDTDIRDEIDRSFGDGPPLAGDDELLTRARGALRRRRLVESAAAAVVTVVALSGAALVSGGDDAVEPMPAGLPATHGSAPQPSTPTSAQTSAGPATPAGPSDKPVIEDDRLPDDVLIDARLDGLHVAPGVEIRRLVDDPWEVRQDGDWSVAVAYTAPGVPLTWWAGYAGADGGMSSASIAAEYSRGLGFAAWVAAQGEGVGGADTATGPGAPPPGGWPGQVDLELVSFVEGTERLEPLDAVTLLQQRAHPDLPRSWADPGDRSAVGEVVFEDVRYYVLARSTPGAGAPQYIAVKSSRGGATLDDFLDFARKRYAEGGGGLL